nr:MBOAT family O-acyltransferase [Wansuia hejianensis]
MIKRFSDILLGFQGGLGVVFSSLTFIFVFLPVVILIYYIAPKGMRNLIFLMASLIFYAWGEPVYILIMLFSTVFDYVNGLAINRFREDKRITRAVLINSLVINLGILGFFKYFGFIVSNINGFLGLNIPIIEFPLPLGISFYTFQTLSYTIDVYLNKVPVQRNIISFGTYVTMFPQLVAGPIVRYSEVCKELDKRQEKLKLFGEGAELFIIGLSKKVLLANNIGLLWDTVKSTSIDELTVLLSWLGIMAFTLQIYFDFSGYSDMALGLGKMFGFNFPRNFNYPYISKSVTEFWRRWHISLGNWFKEYVYIPLGGNRVGKIKQYRNLIVVWLLTGFWHGANWNFIVWGLYYGGILIIEKKFLLQWLENRSNFIRHIYTLLAVIIGWILFEFENMSIGLSYIKTMFGFGNRPLINEDAIYYLYTNGLLLIALIIFSTPIPSRLFIGFKRKLSNGEFIIPITYIFLIFLCTAYLVNETYNPFLYFRF